MTTGSQRPAVPTSTSPLLRGRPLVFARGAWLALAALAVSLFVAGVPYRFNELLNVKPGFVPALLRLGISERGSAVYFMAMELAAPLAFSLIAAVLFWRRSDDWMALLISLDFILVGVSTPPILIALLPAQPFWRLPIDVLASLGLGMGIIGYYLFPDGRFVPPWTRWLALACAAWVGLNFALRAGLGASLPPLAATLVYAGLYATGLFAQVYRYRRVSGPTQRQQTKWAVWGIVPAFIGFCIFNLTPLLVPGLAQPGYDRLVFLLIATPLYITALILIPVSLLFAALRYRLWAIDLRLSRSVVYGTLTGALGVVFLGSVLALQAVFPRLTGGQQSGLALAVAALVMGAFFQPARRRLRGWIDQRFYHEAPAPTERGLPLPVSGLAPGTRLGSYEVIELMGRGGMAEVYRGRHASLGRPVALKVLALGLAAEGNFKQRFEREARTVAALKHPNIVEVFDFGEVEGLYYMALEYVAGQDLAAHLHASGPLPLEQAGAILQDLADALDYAHGQGVVHRDVKPSNVLLKPKSEAERWSDEVWGWQAVLTDFGIARITGATSERLTATGALGTLEYIAPEQILAAKRIDGRADVYSLGILLYEMLTGHLPFSGDNAGALVLAHLQVPPPDPRKLRPDLPASAAEAVLKALAKGPDDRFATAGELAQALRLSASSSPGA